MKKKIFYPILFIVLAMSLMFVGCGGCGGNDSPSVVKKDMTIQETSCLMQVGKSKQLTVSVVGGEKSEIVWTTSDETVVLVDGGTLTAVGIGTATVKAKFGDIEHTCYITVEGSTAYPVITVDESELFLIQGDEYEVNAEISEGGKPVEKSLFWKTSDATVATVSNGVITAVGAGRAEITVYTADKTASSVIIVNVIDGHLFSVNAGDVHIQKSIVNAGDKTFYDITYSAMKNKTEASGTVTWTSQNEAVATVSASGRIEGVSVGTTTVKGEFTFDDNETRTATVNVYVEKSVCRENIGDIGIAADNFEISAQMLAVDELTTAKVYFRGSEIQSTVEGGVITASTAPFKNEQFGSTAISVELGDRVIECEAFLVTRVLRTKQDVIDFMDVSAITTEKGTENKIVVYDGYFTLGNDIDMEGYAGTSSLPFESSTGHNANGMWDYGFQGTFDGRGYSISRLTVNGRMGFFGSIGRPAAVKNVAFKNCTLAINTSSGTGFLGYAFNGKLENVLIDLVGTGGGKYAGAIAARTNTCAVFSGVVVKFAYNGTADKKYIGVLGFRNFAPDTVSSFYVITNLDEIAAFGYNEGLTPPQQNTSYNDKATAIYALDETEMSFDKLNKDVWTVYTDGRLPELKKSAPLNVTLSTYSVYLSTGAAGTTTVTYVADKNGAPVTVTARWQSADESVATVADGVITAVGVGTTKVVLTVTDEYGYFRSAIVNVTVEQGDCALTGQDIEW